MKPSFEELYNLYETERLTTRQIGKRFGVSKTHILRWLKSYGIERRAASNGLLNRGIVEPTHDELYDLIHIQHLGYRDIAALFGVDHTAVTYWTKKYNIPRPKVWDTRYKGNPPTLPAKDELIALYESGQSLTDIGNDFGVSEIVISRLFREFGLQAKPDGWDGGKRLECKDGHRVRSTYEQHICDWLSEHGVPHSYEPPLPCDKRYHADFSANGWYIEIWGVTHNQQYTDRRKKKTQLYRQHGFPLIELNTDFFSSRRRSNLEKRLSKVLVPTPIPLLEPLEFI